MSSNRDSLTVCLMRHAKSDWNDALLGDHDRPLNQRGRRDAPRMAKWLANRGCLPEVILGSTAVRVRETIDGLKSVWTHEPLVLLSSSLYLSTPATICEHIVSESIKADGTRPACVLVVAHNPGMEQLVSQWSGNAVHMSTAEVAIFKCHAIAPEDVFAPRVRHLVETMRPKLLDDR
jgi:phosphohistidine phosphatase